MTLSCKEPGRGPSKPKLCMVESVKISKGKLMENQPPETQTKFIFNDFSSNLSTQSSQQYVEIIRQAEKRQIASTQQAAVKVMEECLAESKKISDGIAEETAKLDAENEALIKELESDFNFKR